MLVQPFRASPLGWWVLFISCFATDMPTLWVGKPQLGSCLMLIGYRPVDHMSDMIRVVKNAGKDWIDANKLTKRPFEWQGSFAAFSYSKKDIPNVIRYIENQEEHHRSKPFLEELVELLKEFEIDYDEKYIFKPLQ